MGEFADMEIDRMFDFMFSDADDCEQELITCRHCGKRGLYLDLVDRKSMLCDPDGTRHNCAKHMFKRYAQK